MPGLAEAIAHSDLENLLSELFFERVPYIFGGSWDVCRSWKNTLASGIGVDSAEIVLVGTAAIGRSLNPAKNLKPFDDHSDVDVAVISEHLFSVAWHHLRQVDLALDALTPAQKVAVKDHQLRYIYWGCVATDRILPIMPFAAQWLSVRSELALLEPTIGRDINFRIYKDFSALRSYQLRGLKKVQLALAESESDDVAELP